MILRPATALRRTWHGVGFLKHFLANVGRPDAAHVMAMERHLSRAATPDELAQFAAVLQDHPVTRQMLAERWLPAPYTRDDLARCPRGSLGQALLAHIVENDLDLDFFPDIDPERPEEFLRLRSYQTHDLWHVVSGYGTSDAGEMGIVGFYLGQFLTHFDDAGVALGAFTGTLASSLLLNASLVRQVALPSMLAHLSDGYTRGSQARPMLAVRWETMFDEPLLAIRERYAVSAPRELEDCTRATA